MELQSRAEHLGGFVSSIYGGRLTPVYLLCECEQRIATAKGAMTDPQVLPGIAFSLDLIEKTGQYGVQEILLSSASHEAVDRCHEPRLISSSWLLSSLRFLADSPS